jgi:hypothetical protein
MPLPDYTLLAEAERAIAASAQSSFRREMHLKIATDYERLAGEALRQPREQDNRAGGLLFGESL